MTPGTQRQPPGEDDTIVLPEKQYTAMRDMTRTVMKDTGLSKRYGNVRAIRGSDFEIRAGEVLAVVGDNGAGTSSLVKAPSGALIPDAGTIGLDGRPVIFRGPADAGASGIEPVYRTRALCPQLNIADNRHIGRKARRPGLLGRLGVSGHRKTRTAAAHQLAALGIAATEDTGRPAGSRRPAVAIARATMRLDTEGKIVQAARPTPDRTARAAFAPLEHA